MDEESDLEQIKGCQKLLNHQTCFWLWRSDTFMERVYYTCCRVISRLWTSTCFFQNVSCPGSRSFSGKSQIDQPRRWCYRINKIPAELPAKSGRFRVSRSDLVSGVHFPLCMRSAGVWRWFIVEGGSVLHVTVTTEFTSGGRKVCSGLKICLRTKT